MRVRATDLVCGALAVAGLALLIIPKHWPQGFESVYSAKSATAYEFLIELKPTGAKDPPLMGGNGDAIGRSAQLSRYELEVLVGAIRESDRTGSDSSAEPKCLNIRSVVIRLETPSGPVDLGLSDSCRHVVVSKPNGDGRMVFVGNHIKKFHDVAEMVLPGALASGQERLTNQVGNRY